MGGSALTPRPQCQSTGLNVMQVGMETKLQILLGAWVMSLQQAWQLALVLPWAAGLRTLFGMV